MANKSRLSKFLNDNAKITPATTGSTAHIVCWSVGSVNEDKNDGRN